MEHCLSLEGMNFYANHGYHAHEKEVGGSYSVDIHLYLSLERAGKTDQLEDTVNYEQVYQLVQTVMNEPKHLIESIAYQIIEQLEQQFEGIDEARVKVSKIQPPIKGDVTKATVEFRKNFRAGQTESNYWEERAKY